MSWGRQPWGVIGGAGGDDSIPPAVAYNPPSGTPGSPQYIDPSQIIEVTVTDLFLKRVFLYAQYPNGYSEVIWAQEKFFPLFAPMSTREPVSNGWKYRLRRSGNWPASPTIHCDAYDTSANEA